MNALGSLVFMQGCIENGSAVFWLELGSIQRARNGCAAAFAADEIASVVETAAAM
jgi:hypothetical protein